MPRPRSAERVDQSPEAGMVTAGRKHSKDFGDDPRFRISELRVRYILRRAHVRRPTGRERRLFVKLREIRPDAKPSDRRGVLRIMRAHRARAQRQNPPQIV